MEEFHYKMEKRARAREREIGSLCYIVLYTTHFNKAQRVSILRYGLVKLRREYVNALGPFKMHNIQNESTFCFDDTLSMIQAYYMIV